MRDPLVLVALIGAAGTVAAGVLALLSHRGGKRIDAREAEAERLVVQARQAADDLEEARLALIKVKDDHLVMVTEDNAKLRAANAELRASNAELAAKVASYEARPTRKDDGCAD